MINQPVFAFANIEDYKALNEAILPDEKFAFMFFAKRAPRPDAVGARARESLKIIQRVKSRTNQPPPYQAPPLSPLDNTYFSAAPFSLGEGKVMKFACKPVNPMSGDLGDAIKDPDYLRNAMLKRMAEAGGKDLCFDFQIQVRDSASLAKKRETEIENVCTEWNDPWITVARIAIPPQDMTTQPRREFCETLFYTPWHGLVDHRPLGGINRLRQKVYDESAKRRGCPVSPDLPSPGRRNRGLEARAEAKLEADRFGRGGSPGRQSE
jgi:hypothetical protein